MARGKHYGAAAEFARKKFGGDLVEAEANPTIGTTAADLVARDPERVFVLIINMSANTVYIRCNGEPSSTNGIILAAQGGAIAFDVENDATMPAKGWRAIASGAGSLLYVLTLRRETLSEMNAGNDSANGAK